MISSLMAMNQMVFGDELHNLLFGMFYVIKNANAPEVLK